jgi:Phosphoribosyl-ATP pyrophosphohydrolase
MKSWPQDIHEMHDKFGHRDAVKNMDPETLRAMLKFRIDFLQEELDETRKALNEDFDPEEIIDGCIDLCVVAIGTIDLFDVDVQEAWDRVHAANMSNKAGIKPGRPNPLGLPDLMKPEGWVAPNHLDNHGFMAKAFEE